MGWKVASLLDESEIIAVEGPPWDLSPSLERVDAIDRALRLRLVSSLIYLGEVASLDARHQTVLERITEQLESAPVSPWVFGLYSKLVAELSKDPQKDAGEIFDDIARAASLRPDEGIVAFADPALPAAWWNHFRLLFDTDRQRPFKPQSPSSEDFALCQKEIETALALLERADPIWRDEVGSLMPMIVLGAPRSADAVDLFNGASTFFLWGASLINANLRRSTVSLVDLLVHESSHVLLFGVSADSALTTNSGHERYDSPVRKDKRPIDGIFHACFVSTRVHLALEGLLRGASLSGEDLRIARDRQEYNGTAARAALDTLAVHAKPTERGDKILGTLRSYWASAAP